MIVIAAVLDVQGIILGTGAPRPVIHTVSNRPTADVAEGDDVWVDHL